jgi:DNA-binding response OmpR family regulator
MNKAIGTVLLVEDNKNILDANRRILEEEGHTVLCAETLEQARLILADTTPDIAVLDIMLPDGDGIEFLPELRTYGKIPVLFLSSKAEKSDRLDGLRAGGNDYITKPYDIDEFCARVETALEFELSKREVMPEKIVKGLLTLDILSNQAMLKDEVMDLTVTEFKLLYLCMQNEGKTMSFEEIYETVWKRPMAEDNNAVKSAVKRMRHKINQAGYDIRAVRGQGYRFEKL